LEQLNLNSTTRGSHHAERGRLNREGQETARINRLLASEQNLNFLLETILEISIEMIKASEASSCSKKREVQGPRLAQHGQAKPGRRRRTRENSAPRWPRGGVTSKSVLVTNAQSDERFQDAEKRDRPGHPRRHGRCP
jgi:hypothetical protein